MDYGLGPPHGSASPVELYSFGPNVNWYAM